MWRHGKPLLHALFILRLCSSSTGNDQPWERQWSLTNNNYRSSKLKLCNWNFLWTLSKYLWTFMDVLMWCKLSDYWHKSHNGPWSSFHTWICWSYYVLIEVKAMPKALVGSPAEHSWCNLSNLNLSTARCQQFIARFMCIGLKANIPSSFMSFSERFYSQVLRQMVTRLLDMTTTLLLESS